MPGHVELVSAVDPREARAEHVFEVVLADQRGVGSSGSCQHRLARDVAGQAFGGHPFGDRSSELILERWMFGRIDELPVDFDHTGKLSLLNRTISKWFEGKRVARQHPLQLQSVKMGRGTVHRGEDMLSGHLAAPSNLRSGDRRAARPPTGTGQCGIGVSLVSAGLQRFLASYLDLSRDAYRFRVELNSPDAAPARLVARGRRDRGGDRDRRTGRSRRAGSLAVRLAPGLRRQLDHPLHCQRGLPPRRLAGALANTLSGHRPRRIFVAIAGTYTPVCVTLLSGDLRRSSLVLIWVLAALGVGVSVAP